MKKTWGARYVRTKEDIQNVIEWLSMLVSVQPLEIHIASHSIGVRTREELFEVHKYLLKCIAGRFVPWVTAYELAARRRDEKTTK